MTDRCCATLERHLDGWSCSQHADRFTCPDALLAQAGTSGPIGLIVHDGGTAAVLISNCPWCGATV